MQQHSHDLQALAALAEGRLEAAERQRVMAHVADCRDCRQILAELGRARAAGSLPSDERASPQRSPSTRVWLPVAASVLVGAFAWFLLESPWRSAAVTDDSPPGADIANPDTDDLLRKRGAGRRVGDKTFRMSGGEWVDAALDASSELPVIVVSGLEQRSALLVREPQLAPFAALGNRVVVVWQGTVYRFEP